ncbi:MAG TPA: hypothetical protein VMK13_16650 [Streptosporangiaceae bacterium]|nr:hypothetical protein [Streptosporangiaceae bacterium]
MPPADPLTAIAGEHPQWSIWVSSTGRYWASFTGALNAAELAAGCVPFVQADDPAALAASIRDQETCRDRVLQPGRPAPDSTHR